MTEKEKIPHCRWLPYMARHPGDQIGSQNYSFRLIIGTFGGNPFKKIFARNICIIRPLIALFEEPLFPSNASCAGLPPASQQKVGSGSPKK